MSNLLPIIARSALSNARYFNCWTGAITKKHRPIYERSYPTMLVLPDGSSINIEYHEPRRIITLPLDLSTLTEEEMKARLNKRKPKTKIKIAEELDDSFDAMKYLKMKKK